MLFSDKVTPNSKIAECRVGFVVLATCRVCVVYVVLVGLSDCRVSPSLSPFYPECQSLTQFECVCFRMFDFFVALEFLQTLSESRVTRHVARPPAPVRPATTTDAFVLPEVRVTDSPLEILWSIAIF